MIALCFPLSFMQQNNCLNNLVKESDIWAHGLWGVHEGVESGNDWFSFGYITSVVRKQKNRARGSARILLTVSHILFFPPYS